MFDEEGDFCLLFYTPSRLPW